MCCGVGSQLGQGLDWCWGWLDVVAMGFQQRPCLAFGFGDGAGHDAEELGEHVLRCPEALAQDGDQDLLCEAERGLVASGWFAGGRAAAGDVEGGLALGLVGGAQCVDQLIPLGRAEAGQGRMRPAGAFGLAGGWPRRGRRCRRLGAQGVVPVAVPVVLVQREAVHLLVADLDPVG